MAQRYSRELLRRTVAHVCQLIGWHGIHAGPLDVLVHVLEKYILTLATQAHRRAEHSERTEPTLADLAGAFRQARVRLAELRDYARQVPAAPPALRPPPYPLPSQDRLHFLRPGSQEVLTRPAHVHEHLPPVAPTEPAPPSPAAPPPDDARFKRPADPASAPPAKRRPERPGDEGPRELSSVMMTVSGFLSPAREGKLPEARPPAAAEVPAPAVADKKRRNRAPNGRPDKRRRDKGRADLENRPDDRRPLFHPDVPVKAAKRELDAEPPGDGAPLSERTLPPPSGNDVPRPTPKPTPIPEIVRPAPPIAIKEEKPDPEKLTSQPDRLKLDIFKKISTKIKEEKPTDPAPARFPPEGVTVKVEKSSPESASRAPQIPLFSKRKSPPAEPRSTSAIDLTSKRGNREQPPAIDPDFLKRKIKLEPPDDPPEPPPPSKPKLSVVPHDVLTGAIPKQKPSKASAKEKREKKQRERRLREERVMRDYRRLLEEQADQTKRFNAATSAATVRQPFPFPYRMPGMFPNFPGGAAVPGLVPNVDIFANGPSLRGLRPPPGGVPNPFSTVGSAFLPSGPGLIPPGFVNPPTNHAFGRPPNIPVYLRRPSLEVIPIEDDDESRSKRPSVDSTRERIEANFLANDVDATVVKRPTSPKANPIIPVPQVKPDVTIKLNAPTKPRPAELDAKIFRVDPEADPIGSKERDRSEKKRDKPHKKEKKDREQKIKKKKDKRDRLKLKLEKKKEKEERQESKEKIKKEKKEKRREKEKRAFRPEGVVPKLTLKLGPASPMPPPSPDPTKKLNIKPVVRRDEPLRIAPAEIEPSRSPELAQILPLYTRPPKVKSGKRVKTEPGLDDDGSPPSQSDGRGRPPPPTHAKLKKIVFKHVPKRDGGDFDDPTIDFSAEETPPPRPESVPIVPPGTPYYMDAKGERVWICPACGRPDNGTPMIGCDGCDAWYHWVCVGICEAPEDEDWFCGSCIAKRTAQASARAAGHVGKKRGRKPKTDKPKEN